MDTSVHERMLVTSSHERLHECNYNPFQYLRSDADVDAMIDRMMLNTQKHARTECITGNLDCTMLKKNLLKAFIFYILDHAPEEKKKPATLMDVALRKNTKPAESGNV